MKHYVITRVTAQPDWTHIPVLSIDTKYLQTSDQIHANAQLCYDDSGILVHLWADVPEIRAVETGPTGTPCKDSCLEFFFQPVAGDARYINLEFNYNGCYYLGVGTGLDDKMRLLPGRDADTLFAPDIRRTKTGWEIYYKIPYAFIRRLFPAFDLIPGMSMRANCYACSDLTVPHYYLSWNPVKTDPFTFHRSECFGKMTFSDSGT